MNNNDLIKEITILHLRDKEILEIEIKYEDFIILRKNLLNKGEDWFDNQKYRRYIKFNSIEKIIWKTKYIELPQKTNWYLDLSKEDKEKIKQKIEKMMKETFEWRKKRFILQREKILLDLWKDEEKFWLEKTISKLKKYNILKNKQKKDELYIQRKTEN